MARICGISVLWLRLNLSILLLTAWIPSLSSFALQSAPIRLWPSAHTPRKVPPAFGRHPCSLRSTFFPKNPMQAMRKRSPVRMNLSPDERTELWDEIARLELELTEAIEEEAYSSAAELRDKVKEMKRKDPYCKAEKELEDAIEGEKYDEAARLRNVMKEVGKPPVPRLREKRIGALEGALAQDVSEAGEMQQGKTYSDTVTQKTRVQVETFYLPEASAPTEGRFLFGYNVTITNLNEETCQLVSRNWVIKPCSGEQEEVSGSGVVGRQPVLAFNESFSYSSACPLNVDPSFVKALPEQRVLGSMEGSYMMVSGALGQTMYQALIAPFSFILPADVEIP